MSLITKDLRERIARKAVNATFDPKAAEIKKREAKLAIECYNHIFPKKIRDIIAKVPAEWLRSCSCLRFNANGWQVSLNAGEDKPTPATNHCSMLGVVDGDLGKRVQDFSTEKKALDDEWRTALTKMQGFLEQFRTFKKLEEAWPEGKKFYKEFNADRPSANVPAVITKEINAMLGIEAKAS